MNTPTTIFSGVEDPRQEWRCLHPLENILFIALATMICNGEDFEDMVIFGEQNYEWLAECLDLSNGIPSHDTFNRVLQRLRPDSLLNSLKEDGQQLLDVVNEKQVILDGKKLRGVSPNQKGNKGLYILSAWVGENNICIGQQKVKNKSNEITAIPELLDSIELAGATVSIDAIGCQREIAQKITQDCDAQYFLSLKKNQRNSYQIVEDAFRFHNPSKFDLMIEEGHGRKEERKCTIISMASLPEEEQLTGWEGLKNIVKIESNRNVKGKESKQVRFYMSSEEISDPKYYNLLARGHWSIENQLHWHLDVTFNEDACRARKDHSAENLNILRKIALQRISRMDDKLSKKKRRYKASMDHNYLISIIS
ncbi:ISAs1 family transposase [Persicobacter sp. CCB-QB2]|uniref:ISAs1 family transposase n=1 Tax=Persicobacter sp. CCB-QB2 TaxID=1561025 RepID=UPI0006A9B931|nr:ISAs1 family transposase [Persicobacter sp. CCB-QB2]